jgi:23S rRNA (pseudouridine1915-N3)-methyltransferase
MKLIISNILTRRGGLVGPASEWIRLYVARSSQYVSCEHRIFASEAKLLIFLDEVAARTRPFFLLTDSTGTQITSEELAATLTKAFDMGAQTLVLAIGPADGWSPAARRRADQAIAFGRITLPHELAAVVAAEQLYRALTIRAGHPYHSGH